METQIKEIWDEVCKIVKTQVTDVTYETVIKVLSASHINENTFYMIAPNKFFKESVDKRYIKLFKNALKKVTNLDLYVSIINQDEKVEDSDTDKISNSNLILKYTFDTFVRAKSNDFAYATAKAVAQSPGTTNYNPLFLYGGVGLGKTHLMHSIGNYIREYNKSTRILYCSTETFMNELINSIQQNKNQEFRNKYRETDVLLIDDIQFLSDRERTQEEFFHTFNELKDANKQIVISSDKPPKEIKTLESRLISRFGQGIIVDLKLPDFETRIAILEKKSEIDNIVIPKDVNIFIADNFYSNIRDLEGALNRVIAYSKLGKTPVDLNLAKEALKNLLTEKNKDMVDVPYIQQIVGNYFNVTIEEIQGQKRTKNIVYSRQIAMYLSRKLLDIPLKKIGKFFGNRDHSTVIHGCEKIDAMLKKDLELKSIILEIEKQISDAFKEEI